VFKFSGSVVHVTLKRGAFKLTAKTAGISLAEAERHRRRADGRLDPLLRLLRWPGDEGPTWPLQGEGAAAPSACPSPCGNGRLDAGEACDDGNLVDGDGCDSNCTPTGCGNGIVTAGEECEQSSTCPHADDACVNCVCVGRGDVSVTLTWTSDNDLDLHVIDPNGEEIFYGNRTSASGGTLDHDANGDCSTATTTPENVFWPVNGAPAGMYTVLVNYFNNACSPVASEPFTVQTIVDGVETTYPGTVSVSDDGCGMCGSNCLCTTVTTFTR